MIIWGKKIKYQRVGFVADFCPMCCRARPFVLERIGVAGHLYFVSFGQGELHGYQRACCRCHNVFNAEPDTYASFAKEPMPMPELIKQTFPQLATARKERLLLESHIRTAPLALPDDVRRQLILEPFQLVEWRYTQFKQRSGFRFEGGFLKKEIIPEIARTLLRLRPTEQELADALARMSQLKSDLGKKIKLKHLMAELNGRAAGTIAADAGALAGSTRGRSLDAHQKLSLAFRVLGGLCAMGAVLGGFAALSPKRPDGLAQWEMALLAAAVAGLAVLCFKVHKGILDGANWARITAIMLCLPLLFLGVPIGTILGAYMLWQLIKGWNPIDLRTAFA